MDLVGEYLRLRRELLELTGHAVENEHADRAPFLDTISWLAPTRTLL